MDGLWLCYNIVQWLHTWAAYRCAALRALWVMRRPMPPRSSTCPACWRWLQALGWASGFRLYAVVFLVGMMGVLGWMPLPPGLAVLQNPWC